MGGHAFPLLHCPRIPPEVYAKVKTQTTTALCTIFSHVIVPTEMPEKKDYGDIDFLVTGPFHSPAHANIATFDWDGSVVQIKCALNTEHGRQGFKNPGCMYFAICAPGHEDEYWVQVDVKVCFKPKMFRWETFQLSYASNSKMIGSMVKPLGFTIDPDGLHLRVEEFEETNFPGSMVWLTKDPRDLLRLAGLDRRILDSAFKTKDEIYEYFASSWLFNPGHFAARLAEGKYHDRLEDRSPHWTYFVKEWVPKHFPGHKIGSEHVSSNEAVQATMHQANAELKAWYTTTRATMREKVFTMFPHVATQYYTKRAAYVKKQEELRLRALIATAIPVGDNDWKDNSPQPRIIIIKQQVEDPSTTEIKPSGAGGLRCISTATEEASNEELNLSDLILPNAVSLEPIEPWNIPLYLKPLPRSPPLPCTPRAPPSNMSPEAKLLCLVRWTLFDSINGTPYLLSTPRNKDFKMSWTDAIYLGATDRMLVKWAREMWWYVWIRQSHMNYVGMWKKRFEKEDRRKERIMEKEAEAEGEAGENGKSE